jgi:hypothetical protein
MVTFFNDMCCVDTARPSIIHDLMTHTPEFIGAGANTLKYMFSNLIYFNHEQ